MPRVENKCTNCRFWMECDDASNNMVVVWKHCSKFKPSLDAIREAKEREEEAQKQKTIEELRKL